MIQRKDKHDRPIFTIDEWQAEGNRLFGPDINTWRFKCPACGHVQTRANFLSLGMKDQVDRYLGFSCIGRFRLSDLNKAKLVVEYPEMDKGAGCNYAGGGLFQVAPIIIETGKDEQRLTFGFAE